MPKMTRRGFLQGLGAFALTTIVPKGSPGKDRSPSPAQPKPEPELEEFTLQIINEAVNEQLVATTPDWGSFSGPALWGFQPGDLVTIHGDEPTAARVKSIDPFRLEPVDSFRRVGPTDTTLIGSVGPLSKADKRLMWRYQRNLQFRTRFGYGVPPFSMVDPSLT